MIVRHNRHVLRGFVMAFLKVNWTLLAKLHSLVERQRILALPRKIRRPFESRISRSVWQNFDGKFFTGR